MYCISWYYRVLKGLFVQSRLNVFISARLVVRGRVPYHHSESLIYTYTHAHTLFLFVLQSIINVQIKPQTKAPSPAPATCTLIISPGSLFFDIVARRVGA